MHPYTVFLVYLLQWTITAFSDLRSLAPTPRTCAHPTLLHKSLFDEAENDDDTPSGEPSSRKFTGQGYFKDGPSVGGRRAEGSRPPVSPREQMRQREFNLVSVATSPAAYIVQAASILILLVFVVYVGATGQLGINNEYEDDYFNYDPDTVVVPESIVPASKESVWL